MADIFRRKDMKNLLKGKFILILGDSNLRALYRDLIWLYNNDAIIPISHLKRKLDFSYLGDRLLKQGKLNRGRDYVEMREYSNQSIKVKFNFLTKCVTKEVEALMKEYKDKATKCPDIVLVNSCLWDITRWGPDGVNLYKKNLLKLMELFKTSLPVNTLVIFNTTLPISSSCSGAFLVKQVEFMKHSLRFEVMEANLFVRQLVPTYGYNILDFHYHFRMQIHRRDKDGVHWFPEAIRYMTNLFLTHIALSWGKPLPGNFYGKLLARMKESAKITHEDTYEVKLPKAKNPKVPIMPPPKTPVATKFNNKKKKNKNMVYRPNFNVNVAQPILRANNNVSQPVLNLVNNLIQPVFTSVNNANQPFAYSDKNYVQPSLESFYDHTQPVADFSAYTPNFEGIGVSRLLFNSHLSQPTVTFFNPSVYHNPANFYEDPSIYPRVNRNAHKKFKAQNRHVNRAAPY